MRAAVDESRDCVESRSNAVDEPASAASNRPVSPADHSRRAGVGRRLIGESNHAGAFARDVDADVDGARHAARQPFGPLDREHAVLARLRPGRGRRGWRRRQAIQIHVVERHTAARYSCTSVNVGLLTGSSARPSPSARPRTKAVLPAPRSPSAGRRRRREPVRERDRDAPRLLLRLASRTTVTRPRRRSRTSAPRRVPGPRRRGR